MITDAEKIKVVIKKLPLFGKKEETKFWKYDAKYVGGHAAFAKETDGKLYLYPKPEYKVIFESKKANMTIPLNAVKDSKIATEKEFRKFMTIGMRPTFKKKMLAIEFQDQLGNVQSPTFEVDKLDEVANMLYNLRLEMQSKA